MSSTTSGSSGWDPFSYATSMQGWADLLLKGFKDQVEGQQRMLASATQSMQAMEQALAAQEATNRALRETLEGYRQVMSTATAAQASYVELIQGALDTLNTTMKAQSQAAEALSAPMEASLKTMQDFTQQWFSAYQRLLQPPGSGSK
jgi:hypothetical protein